MILRVRDWETKYENNRTRELKRMDWVPVPNRMDGLGYTQLVRHPNGAAHLGCWLAIVEIASRCDIRGTLVRDGAVLTPAMLSGMSQLNESLIIETIERCLDPVIGWLEEISEVPNKSKDCSVPQDDAVSSAQSRRTVRDAAYARARNGTEEKGTEASVIGLEKQAPATGPIALALSPNPIASSLADFAPRVGLPEPDPALIKTISGKVGGHRAEPFRLWLEEVRAKKREISWGLLSTMVGDGDFDRWVRSRKMFA